MVSSGLVFEATSVCAGFQLAPACPQLVMPQSPLTHISLSSRSNAALRAAIRFPTASGGCGKLTLAAAAIVCLCAPISAERIATGTTPVRFNRDVRPILSGKCFACHGPDEAARQGDLRLDDRAAASGVLSSERPEDSILLARIKTADDTRRMPPAESQKQLSAAEVEILDRWISAGAPYEQHWAFVPLKRTASPRDLPGLAENSIDAFVRRRLASEDLGLSPPADRRTLIRRVTLDLTGLPPTPTEIQDYLADLSDADTAYENVVDRLLNSPRFGEHFAYRWLDAARYADSDGYESDPLRTMWPWRDWVVAAFNSNMAYDDFLTEQLAGDLLDSPTLPQRLATGFNRNHRLNNEGGILPEEWLIEYVADRTETAVTVFMGLTWGCARCHDHKFDPITQADYYRFFAFFHNVPEKGKARGDRDAAPMLHVPRLDLMGEYEANSVRLESLLKASGVSQSEDERQSRENEICALELRQSELLKTGAKVMVMAEMDKPRATHILTRGAYDRPGVRVDAGTPSWLPGMTEGLPRNRLGLARWLTNPEHPLTARVAVNRFWEHYFGRGLVKTQEDFGSQGDAPSHPELLDFLAREFVTSGWNVKKLQKLIVCSQTYRQSSQATPALLRHDPENRLLGRGARLRLSAAIIRDQALVVSGLLNEQMGGAPVKPYQPEGLWREIIKGGKVYYRDSGDKLYRRSLYTLWRRAVKPPLMMLLDANERDTCRVTQKRTNTPLQALLLLNDVTFVEAARAFAARLIRDGGDSPAERVRLAMEFVVARPPTEHEQKILLSKLDEYLAHYRADTDAARKLIGTGESRTPSDLNAPELAAYTAVARILLNLDETLTRE